MPPGAGVAARASAGVVGRRIPYVALAFLAYDAYQLACSLGLIPASACPRPDNPSPGSANSDLEGGQCQDWYLVYITFSRINPNGLEVFDNDLYVGQLLGPIGGIFMSTTSSLDGLWLVGNAVYGPTQTNNPSIWGLFNATGINEFKLYSFRTTRASGAPDNCGNLPPKPAPQTMPDQINNIINFNRNINLNFNVPNPQPPTPQPKPAPRLISPPSPFPDININFGDNYFGGGDTDYDFDIDFNFSPAPKGNFNDYPDIFNNFPPSPQPQTKEPDPFAKDNPPPQPAPQPKPLPELPPPLPDKLPENSTEENKYIYRQNKETLDKVYKANAEILEIQEEQLKQRKILENIQSLLDFEVEGSQLIKRCDDVELFYSYKDKILKAITKQLNHVAAIEQTIINEVCEIEVSTVSAIPDWWQVRLGADVPQLALVFRKAFSKTYYQITIPHPLNTNKLVIPPIGSYEKGNWMAEAICVDNSKLIVNCKTKTEAQRVMNLAIELVDPIWLGDPHRLYFAERKGIAVQPGEMKATSALYFSTGQQDAIPDWRVSF
jgi:hypothetical protein